MIKSLTRILAFTSNWTALVARQPSMLLSMIVGPFLILLLFGIGIVSQEPPPDTIVVTQERGTETPFFEISPQDLSTYLNVVEVTDDLDYALEQLSARRVRLVMLLPERPLDTIRSGERAIITVFSNEIDPVRLAFIRIDLRAQIAVLNNSVQARAINAGKDRSGELDDQLTQAERALQMAGTPREDIRQAREIAEVVLALPTEVLVAPFETEMQNVAPSEPSITGYFTPAAIALVIQHLAVTLAGLSMVRARLLGMIELWQVSPVRLGEIVAGNYLSYGILTLIISVVLILAVVWALYVVVLGSVVLFWVAIVLLLLASLGYGFVISLVSGNEQTASQAAMIILLASVFLGGFVQPLEMIIPGVRVISYLLPATYAVQILQDVMLRGEPGDPIYYAALASLGLVGLLATIRLFSRELRPT